MPRDGIFPTGYHVNSESATVELAGVPDAEKILCLQKIAFQSEAMLTDDYSIPPLTQTLKELSTDFQRLVFFKTVVEGNVIGSVRGYLEDGTCFIGRLIVHPDFQNRGLGIKLMHTIENHFVEARRYEVFTGQKSERNIHFYTRLGYRIFRTQPISDKTTLVFMDKPGRIG